MSFSAYDRTGSFLVRGTEISLSDCGPRSGLLEFVLVWFGTSLITPSENRTQVGLPPASPVICTSLYDSHFGTSAPVCRLCFCQRRVRAGSDEESLTRCPRISIP